MTIKKKPVAKQEEPNQNDRTVISLAISKHDLARLDEAAKKQRCSRAAFIRLALVSEIHIDAD